MGQWCTQAGLGGWAGMLVFWALIFAVVIWAVVRLFPGQRSGGARSALDERLARGEIDAETYRLIREELESGSAARPG